MGGQQSTRKVTVDNDNAIQVSQEALDRIQSQLNAKQAEQPRPVPQSQFVPRAVFPTYEEHRKQEFIEEEAYWNQRIESLKRAHEKITSGMQLEYQKTLKEANELFNSVQQDKIVNKQVPCQEEKAKVLKCYNTNPDQSLLCSVVVNEFNDCVCRSRIAAITASS